MGCGEFLRLKKIIIMRHLVRQDVWEREAEGLPLRILLTEIYR
jgi:hypothetical protein